jgi:hypothetical protein
MSRIDAKITKQKRRRHSSEPSPNSILTPDHKSLRKKLNFDSDLHIDLYKDDPQIGTYKLNTNAYLVWVPYAGHQALDF